MKQSNLIIGDKVIQSNNGKIHGSKLTITDINKKDGYIGMGKYAVAYKDFYKNFKYISMDGIEEITKG
jgi:hypothetical protein